MTIDFEKFRSFVQKMVPTMGEDDIKMFSSKAQKAVFKKSDLFVKEGEICKKLIFIHEGMFRYYILHEGCDITKDFALDTLNPFCTSYTSFMLQKPSEIWIEALEESQVWSWNQADIQPLFQNHLAWILFAKVTAETLFFRKEQKEIELLKHSAEERYKNFLIHFPGLSQRAAQYHIATYLGIKPESLSRIRKKLL